MSTPDGKCVLEIEDRGRVRILRLNRPAKLNALNHALIDALPGGVADAGRDPRARATNERRRIARRGRAVSDPVTQGGQ